MIFSPGRCQRLLTHVNNIFIDCCWKSWVTVCEHKHNFLLFPVRTDLWPQHLAPNIKSHTWYPPGVPHHVVYKVSAFFSLILCVFFNVPKIALSADVDLLHKLLGLKCHEKEVVQRGSGSYFSQSKQSLKKGWFPGTASQKKIYTMHFRALFHFLCTWGRMSGFLRPTVKPVMKLNSQIL